MRAPAALTLALLAGCAGGSPATTGPAAAPAAAPPAPPTAPAVAPAATPAAHRAPGAPPAAASGTSASRSPAASTDCDRLGISRAKLREGPCTHGDLEVYVANRGTTAPLPELSVRLEGVGVQPAKRGRVYVNVALTVTNRLDRAVAFDPRGDQAVLNLGSQHYAEDLTVDSAPGIARPWRGVPIDPGASQPARIVFTIPERYAKRLATVGNVAVSQFSDAGRRSARGRIAILRTYH